MGLLDQALAVDAQLAFSQVDDFAECGTYSARDGTTRTVYGVVQRDPPMPLNSIEGAIAPVALMVLPNSTTHGITSAELILNVDTISIPRHVGKVAETFTIRRIVEQDTGMLTLELR